MSPSPPESVLRLALGREPTLGAGRLICIDGPAGSGKTTLAAAVSASAIDDVHVVHMDDLFPGWSGLAEVDAQLADLLLPLAEDRPGAYRRYDWVAGEFAETVTVDPTPLLVIEGVGSGAARFAELVTVLVWVEAPYDL
ncbi:MAG: 4-amino-4-deoxy-L-arabinose transferase, partial [Marmoricola sp.]